MHRALPLEEYHPDQMVKYSKDWGQYYWATPRFVSKPQTLGNRFLSYSLIFTFMLILAEEVVSVFKYATENKLKIAPRGSGHSIEVYSLSRFILSL
jgi:FAD/FMN-containing dehydrogenase